VATTWFFITAAFVGLAMLFRGSVDPTVVEKFTLAFSTLAPAYFAFVFGSAGYKQINAAFKRLRTVPGASLYRCRFFETRLTYENDAGMECTVPYSLVRKLTPEEDGILIVVDQGRFLWVPKESFATHDEFQEASRWRLSAQLAKNPSSGPRMN
jgi:hypothetical protein